MPALGILMCEVLELEFAHLLASDPDIVNISVVEDGHSQRFIRLLEERDSREVRCLREASVFQMPDDGIHILVQVLELALHDRKKRLQRGLADAAEDMGSRVDALLLGYGLCGNALENPSELLSDAGAPVFLPMDEDHPVDDCVGLLIGGRENYYGEQCRIAGTFFMIPGWTHHWRRVMDVERGGMGVDLARRMFAHYERSLLVTTPLLDEGKMRENIQEFNELFGLRTEARPGTLDLLAKTYREAKAFVLGANPSDGNEIRKS